MNRSKATTDHDEIRRWAESRGGKPTAVKGTKRGKNDVGMIRIDFPGYSGEGKLEPISWDEWFGKFDQSNLAMILQDETAKGQMSHFNKLVARESLEPDEGGKGMHVNKAKSRRATRRSAQTSARRTSASARPAKSSARPRTRSSKTTARAGSTRRSST